MPDIRQAKSLAQLYHTTLDDLIQYDAQVEEIQRVIRHTSEETQQKVDWTKLWGEMYPVLTTYPQQVDIPPLHSTPGGAAPGFGIHLPLHAFGRLFGAQGHSGQDVDRPGERRLKEILRISYTFSGSLAFSVECAILYVGESAEKKEEIL